MRITYFLLLSLALLSCKKKQEEEKPADNNTTVEIKNKIILSDYVKFDIGTKWVYLDSVSGFVDTVELVSQEIVKVLNYETFTNEFSSNLYVDGIEYDSEFPNEDAMDLSIIVYKGINYFNTAPDTTSYLGGKCINQNASISINNTVYDSVRVFSSTGYNLHSISYWKKDYGLIKYNITYPDTTVAFELINLIK